jgi:hypothetical protein
MTYVKKTLFAANGFALHRWDVARKAWQTTPLPSAHLEKRFVCGQDGQGAMGEIRPQSIEALCVAGDRIFASARLVPAGSFSGYWPCIELVAERSPDRTWKAAFAHHPAQLNQQGEQPLVLNISNKGEMILGAVGHDDVVDLFARDGQAWSVTENCVAWFDAAASAWRKVAELTYNFYWRPSALLDEGGDTILVGTDRGIVSQIDVKTRLCRTIGALKDRSIARILRQDGRVVVVGAGAPPGCLPAYGLAGLQPLDSDAAVWNGQSLAAVPSPSLPAVEPLPWLFKPMEGESTKKPPFRREQTIGNMLWGPGADQAQIPLYYLKEVYAPEVLGFSPDGKRLWCSVFGGLFVADLPKAKNAQ